MTIETKAHIEQSEKVLYLANEPAIAQWIEKNSKNAESLNHFYQEYTLRKDCYDAIAHHVLKRLQEHETLCFVLYGHPTIFAQPGLTAAKLALDKGFDAKILPGISAEDCLFTDLLINPGNFGIQSFEATDFLIRNRKWDSCSYLVLWQVGFVGILDHTQANNSPNGFSVLKDHLLKQYEPQHNVFLYEAAQYPHLPPRIETYELQQLSSKELTEITTLVIPPEKKADYNNEILEKLGINAAELK